MKKWYLSRTLWFNVVTVLVGVVQVVAEVYVIPEEVLALLLGVGNVILRALTKEGLTL